MCTNLRRLDLRGTGSPGNSESFEVDIAAPNAAISAEWADVIDQVKNAIVAIRVTAVRSFEDCAAGVWDGTGFVVSLDNPKEALILTNRHIITTGPIRARATFYEHDDLPIWPVYRDPVHDFGLFQFDSTELRFTPPTAICVAPLELRVGTEVLVIGNDNAEKIQILPATIARTDRNCPEYHDNYEDENTFYAGAGSNTSGGSSGSPVIARSGNCIALNAGGAHEAASAFFLPLDRAVYVLDWLKEHPNEIPLPPRGTLLARWLFQPFDMLRRLGFTAQQEEEVLSLSPDASLNDRQKGLLVVENVIRGTEAEQRLKPGDVLLEVAGKPCLNFVILEEQLDTAVDSEVNIKLSRAGEVKNIQLRVVDFHKLISHDFVECGGGVFHVLSYHTCKTYNIPISERGIYVAQSGFSFGLQIPVSAVITSVAGKKVTNLRDFEAALAGVPNKERYGAHLVACADLGLLPQAAQYLEAEVLGGRRCPGAARAACPATTSDEGYDQRSAAPEASVADASPISDARSRASAEQDSDTVPAALREEDSFGYPENSDAAISMVQPMLCTIVTQVSHEYATDFLQSKEENKSTVIRRFGVGLVIDTGGLVLTDRYTVPQPLVEVELTFGQTVTVNATCLFMHPHHNMVLLHYDPSAVKDLPVRAIELGDAQPKTEELSAGQILSFVSIHSDHQLSAKQVTVGSMCLKVWPFPQPPAYRGRNLEICNLNDTLHGLGGLLIEPAPSYRIRAWFAQFPAGSLRYLAGVPVQVFAAVLASLGLHSSWAAKRVRPLDPKLEVAALECEFEEVSLAKARREDGVPLENARALAACSSGGRRQILRVGRITSGGGCDSILLEGDLVLSINGKPVTKPHEVEREMRKCHSPDSGDGASVSSMRWRVQRSRQPMDLDLTPTLLRSDGTEHIVVFNGVVLRPTPRAVAERGGPTLAFTRPGQVEMGRRENWLQYIYPGSPADTFSFADSRAMRNLGWLVQLNNEPTPSIERLLEIIHSGALSGCEWLRCHVMDAEGRLSVRALRPVTGQWDRR
ncbi:Pro-apoptotic serine protease NMA111 [Durusdinium trenchii]|uniref:Pro-apoptotic serine protease NMA111 n=1 Tax=Durusdinium trenchii TaxID=1381693 RepID=A0ABP0MEP4_9DINO